MRRAGFTGVDMPLSVEESTTLGTGAEPRKRILPLRQPMKYAYLTWGQSHRIAPTGGDDAISAIVASFCSGSSGIMKSGKTIGPPTVKLSGMITRMNHTLTLLCRCFLDYHVVNYPCVHISLAFSVASQDFHYKKGNVMRRLILISAFLLMVVAYNVNAEVKALWLFDEGSGNVAIDSSGNGADGRIEGAQYVQGKYGTALKFDGKSFVDVGFPKSLQEDIDGAFTVEVWVKLDKEPPADHSTIIFMQAGGALAFGFTQSTGGGLYGYAGNNVKITDPEVPFPVGEWVHVAQTFDGTMQRLYRNGEEIASQNAAQAVFAHPLDSPWTIGAWSSQDKYFLENATLDELRVLDEAVEPEDLGFFSRFSPVEPQGKLTASWGALKR